MRYFKTKVSILFTIAAIWSIVLFYPSNSLTSESSNNIDEYISSCYDDCSSTETHINNITYDEVMIAWNKQKREQAEIARIEAERLAEEERIRLAEVAEKERLAKLEKERLRRLEEKKKETAIASRGSGYQSNYEITHYTAQCKGCTGQSAAGPWVNKSVYYQGYRVVAAPPNIKFYTKLRITYADGTKIDAIVLDRGGDIKGSRLDLLVGSKDEAYKLGRQQVKVEIIH